MIKRLNWISLTLIPLALIGIISIEACSTPERNSPAPLPTLDGLDMSTVNKPKKALETPTGVKHVYDPHQDTVLKTAFKGLMQVKQQEGYFEGWPKKEVDRSQQKGAIGEVADQWRNHLNATPLTQRYLGIVYNSRRAQKNDYTRTGCKLFNTRQCLLGSGDWKAKFEPCSDDKADWGSPALSQCELNIEPPPKTKEEATRRRIRDSIATPRHGNRTIWYPRLCAEEKLPFMNAHIGDPERGGFQEQFDAYFFIECAGWRDED